MIAFTGCAADRYVISRSDLLDIDGSLEVAEGADARSRRVGDDAVVAFEATSDRYEGHSIVDGTRASFDYPADAAGPRHVPGSPGALDRIARDVVRDARRSGAVVEAVRSDGTAVDLRLDELDLKNAVRSGDRLFVSRTQNTGWVGGVVAGAALVVITAVALGVGVTSELEKDFALAFGSGSRAR